RGFGRGLGRRQDADVRAAATDVAVDPLADLVLGGVRVLVDERLDGRDEPGRAVAAHEAVVLVEGVGNPLLARVEALEGLDRLALTRDGQGCAGINRIAVDDRGACAAAPAVADPLRTRDVQPIAERVEQRAAWLDLARAILPVDLERDVDGAVEDL